MKSRMTLVVLLAIALLSVFFIAGCGDRSLKIVLSWTADDDLDACLWTPNGEMVYFSDMISSDGSAELLEDSLDGSTPETITISRLKAGKYHFAVWDGSLALKDTGAVVMVYDGKTNEVLSSNLVPNTAADTWWHVFDIDGATGVITKINTVSSDPPGVVPDSGLLGVQDLRGKLK